MFFKNRNKKDSILGIDFRLDEVRIVELEKSNDPKYNYKILNYIIEKVPVGNIKEDKLESSILGEYLKEIAIREKLQHKIAITSIPSSRVMEIELLMPKDASEKEIEDVIKNSGKTYIQTSIDTMSFDFYEVNKEKESQETETETETEKNIMLVMCQKELIESRVETLNNAGIVPLVVDTTNNGYLNIIDSLKKQYKKEYDCEPEGTMLLADISRTDVNLYFYKENNIWSKSLHMEKNSNESNEEFNDRLLTNISKEIKVSNFNDNKIKYLFLMGKLDRLSDIQCKMKNIKEFDKIDVLIANPFLDIKYDGDNYANIIEFSPSLVLACGLAMGEIKKYEY